MTERSPWTDRAACNGLNTQAVFVIDDTRHGRSGRYQNPRVKAKLANALAICHSCPVQQECRQALANWEPPAPRGVVIAAMTPHQAWLYWHQHHPDHAKKPA